MAHKLLAVAVDEWEKEHFQKEVAKLYTTGKVASTTTSGFIRQAINAHLELHKVKFRI